MRLHRGQIQILPYSPFFVFDLTLDPPPRPRTWNISVQMMHGIPSAIMENWGRLDSVCCGQGALDWDSAPLGLRPASELTILCGGSLIPLSGPQALRLWSGASRIFLTGLSGG